MRGLWEKYPLNLASFPPERPKRCNSGGSLINRSFIPSLLHDFTPPPSAAHCSPKRCKSFELHCSPLLQRNFGQGRGISSKFLTLQPTLTSKFWPRGVVIPQNSSHCSPLIYRNFGHRGNSSKVIPLQPHYYIILPPGPNNTLTVTTKWEDFKEDIRPGSL